MMKRSLVLLITLVTMAIARPVAAKPSVAILGLEVTDTGSASGGVDAKSTQFASTLTDVLRQRAKGASGPFSLAPGSDKDLVEMKLLSGCDNEANDCMGQIGVDLAADLLLFGHVEKQAKGYQVSLKLLNVSAKRTEAAAWLSWLKDAANELPLRIAAVRIARVGAGLVDAEVTLAPAGQK
jgi:hypothetical protein